MSGAATYAVLLRAVNVGGRQLAMRDLRTICEAAGCGAVRTYVQSGNVVLRSEQPEAALAADLERRLAEHAGFDVPVIVRGEVELQAIVERCPFATDVDATTLVVAFAAAAPEGGLGSLDPAAFGDERLALVGRDLYLSLPRGQGRSRLAAAVARTPFGAASTSRNWRTVLALRDLARELAST